MRLAANAIFAGGIALAYIIALRQHAPGFSLSSGFTCCSSANSIGCWGPLGCRLSAMRCEDDWRPT